MVWGKKMKCPACKKAITSGVLFFRPGSTYTARGLNPETRRFTPIERHTINRIIAFCSVKCVQTFFLNPDRFNKTKVPFQRRLISRNEALKEFQAVLLSNKEDQKDLVYILGQTIWR